MDANQASGLDPEEVAVMVHQAICLDQKEVLPAPLIYRIVVPLRRLN